MDDGELVESFGGRDFVDDGLSRARSIPSAAATRWAFAAAATAIAFVVGVTVGARTSAPRPSPTQIVTAPVPSYTESVVVIGSNDDQAADLKVTPSRGVGAPTSGWLRVGSEVKPGSWHGVPASTTAPCHYQRVVNEGQRAAVVVFEAFSAGPVTATIEPTDDLFVSFGCVWTGRVG